MSNSPQNKIALLYAVEFGLILSDIIPTPADALYFYWQQKLKTKLQNGEITPKQYWIKETANYYALNPLWWSLVLGATILIKGDYKHKMKIGLGVIGAGAVVGIIYKNIQKDTKKLSQPEKEKFVRN